MRNAMVPQAPVAYSYSTPIDPRSETAPHRDSGRANRNQSAGNFAKTVSKAASAAAPNTTYRGGPSGGAEAFDGQSMRPRKQPDQKASKSAASSPAPLSASSSGLIQGAAKAPAAGETVEEDDSSALNDLRSAENLWGSAGDRPKLPVNEGRDSVMLLLRIALLLGGLFLVKNTKLAYLLGLRRGR